MASGRLQPANVHETDPKRVEDGPPINVVARDRPVSVFVKEVVEGLQPPLAVVPLDGAIAIARPFGAIAITRSS